MACGRVHAARLVLRAPVSVVDDDDRPDTVPRRYVQVDPIRRHLLSGMHYLLRAHTRPAPVRGQVRAAGHVCSYLSYPTCGPSYQRDAAILKGAYNLDRIRHLPEAVNLIQAMISIVPEQRWGVSVLVVHSRPTDRAMPRPSCAEILKHPFFWSDEAKLEVRRLPVNARAVVRAADEVRSWQFLQEMSDRVEVEKPESPIRTALECQAPRVVGRSWDRAIDPALLDNLGKYRKYNFGSIRDCLRVIRNKKNHYRDLPVDVQVCRRPGRRRPLLLAVEPCSVCIRRR